jgi:hypothetical protein
MVDFPRLQIRCCSTAVVPYKTTVHWQRHGLKLTVFANEMDYSYYRGRFLLPRSKLSSQPPKNHIIEASTYILMLYRPAWAIISPRL